MPPLNKFEKGFLTAAICQCLGVAQSQAATITVDAPIESPASGCNLIEAIKTANSATNQDGCVLVNDGSAINTIVLPTDSTQTLTTATATLTGNPNDFTGLPFIESHISIEGNNSTIERVSTERFRLATLKSNSNAVLTIHDTTLKGGDFTNTPYEGAAIYVATGASLTLHNTTISENVTGTGRGAGIFAKGQVFLYESSVTDNSIADTNSTNANARGGGIYIENSILGIIDSTVSNNSARYGGGVFAINTDFGVDSSEFLGNSASSAGGGIFTSTSVTLTAYHSTISGNSAQFGGGISVTSSGNATLGYLTVAGNSAGFAAGISARSSAYVKVEYSTFTANSAGFGAALDARTSANILLTNSTISHNTASTRGSAALTFANGTITMRNSTVSDNSISQNSISPFNGAVHAYGDTGGLISLNNTIVADSKNGLDCSKHNSGVVGVGVATIVKDGTCGALRIGDPGLLPLANNGGNNKTHALKSNSVARDSSTGTCLPKDQLGNTRDISDGYCDIGALEYSSVSSGGFFVIPLKDKKAVVIPE